MKLTNLKKGTKVNYHSPIGSPIVSQHEIRNESWYEENCKQWVCMLTGKAGYVTLGAISQAGGIEK